jgi:hypothetical protein
MGMWQSSPAHQNALTYEIAVSMALVPDASRSKAHAYADLRFRGEFVTVFSDTCFPAGVFVRVVDHETPSHVSVRAKRAKVLYA